MKVKENIVLIAGPTASGKSGIAIQLACANEAIIINTDSMQVYADLQIVSARPGREEEIRAPHLLFGHVDAAQAYSVAHWLSEVQALLNLSRYANRIKIFVGGTGLYFNALLKGISPVPAINPEIRKKWRRHASLLDGEELHAELKTLDPLMAEILMKGDVQRIVRALEVKESTGRSLAEWQKQAGKPLISTREPVQKILLTPDRALLHERINSRFDEMLENGALAEVQSLMARNIDPEFPVMKAIGVSHLSAYLNGELTLYQAMEKAKAATRQYAKRQSTWFRNSLDDNWQIIRT